MKTVFIIVGVVVAGIIGIGLFMVNHWWLRPIPIPAFSASPGATPLFALDLRNKGLDKLPAYVLALIDLQQLDISSNRLTGALPAEIRKLQNLRVLNASNNQMTGVPAEIGQLRLLEVLDLSNNKLTGLPYELGNLQNLKTLNLSGNQYAKQDLDYIRTKLPTATKIIVN